MRMRTGISLPGQQAVSARVKEASKNGCRCEAGLVKDRMARQEAEKPGLKLFGTFALTGAGATTVSNKKAQALLAYLALNPGESHLRERLSALLWSDSSDEAARQSLRQCISVLRRDVPHLPLAADHDTLALDVSGVDIDVLAFERTAHDHTRPALERNAALYRGDLLDGFRSRSDTYDDWLNGERSRLRMLGIGVLRALFDLVKGEQPRDEAYALAHRLLAIDPLMEDMHRALMRMHFDDGETAQALRQYKRCETILKKDLGVEPDTETRALHQEMLRHRTRRSTAPAAPASVREAPAHAAPQPKQDVQTCITPDGVRIAYASIGEGPPLVKTANWLNHLEFDFVSPVWRHWIDALSRDHQFVRYDERGNGLSDWDVFDISFDAFVRDLETVVDAAGLERFALLGISQGCAISVAYAVKHPERVSHLILGGGYAKGWMLLDDPAEITRRHALATLVKEGWGQDNPVFRQIFTSLFMPGASAEQAHWFNDLQKITTSPDNAYRIVNALGLIDVRPLLKEVKAPTLVFHARGDARVSIREGQELAAGIPGARFLPLESSNHLLLGSEPAWDKFLTQVRDFLAE